MDQTLWLCLDPLGCWGYFEGEFVLIDWLVSSSEPVPTYRSDQLMGG